MIPSLFSLSWSARQQHQYIRSFPLIWCCKIEDETIINVGRKCFRNAWYNPLMRLIPRMHVNCCLMSEGLYRLYFCATNRLRSKHWSRGKKTTLGVWEDCNILMTDARNGNAILVATQIDAHRIYMRKYLSWCAPGDHIPSGLPGMHKQYMLVQQTHRMTTGHSPLVSFSNVAPVLSLAASSLSWRKFIAFPLTLLYVEHTFRCARHS